jgi:transposase-like protein
VAQSHGLNANLVDKWRRGQRQAKVVTRTQASDDMASTFVALHLPPQPTALSVRRKSASSCAAIEAYPLSL